MIFHGMNPLEEEGAGETEGGSSGGDNVVNSSSSSQVVIISSSMPYVSPTALIPPLILRETVDKLLETRGLVEVRWLIGNYWWRGRDICELRQERALSTIPAVEQASG